MGGGLPLIQNKSEIKGCVLRTAIVASALLMFSSCSKNKADPFDRPPTQELQGAGDRSRFCSPDAAGKYSEAVTVEKGEEGDSYIWGQGGTCVMRPLREVWAVSQNQPLMVWSKVSSSDYKVRSDLPSGISFFYEVNYVVHNLLTVDWTMEWYHSIKQGTEKAPQQILINYKKVNGTTYIRYWEGSIWLDQIQPNVTAVTIRNQVNASQQGLDEVEITVREVLQKFREGDPNWGPLGGKDP